MSERTLYAASQALRRGISSLAARHSRLRQAAGHAAILTTMALIATPASAQFICTTTPTDRTCTNSSNAQGNAGAFFTDTAAGANQNDTVTNTGTAKGFESQTTGGGAATASNSGSNAANGALGVGIEARTGISGDATASNSGVNAANVINGIGIVAVTATVGNATARNSGANTGGLEGIVASAGGFGGDATASNSGTNAANGPNGIGIEAVTNGGGTATANNSGSNAANGSGGIGIFAQTTVGGNATAKNSGSNAANGPGGIGIFASTLNGGDAAVINSGTTTGGVSISATGGNAILTDIVAARIVGAIEMTGTSQMVNFAGGNWLLTINTSGGGPTIVNAGGAPFVSSSTTVGKSTITQVAVLDPTVFALADRSVANFTGDLSQLLQGRFAAMSSGAGGGALGFAPSDSGVAASAQAAFAGIPSVAMSYAPVQSAPHSRQGAAAGCALLRHHGVGIGLWRGPPAARRWRGAFGSRHRLRRRARHRSPG